MLGAESLSHQHHFIKGLTPHTVHKHVLKKGGSDGEVFMLLHESELSFLLWKVVFVKNVALMLMVS